MRPADLPGRGASGGTSGSGEGGTVAVAQQAHLVATAQPAGLGRRLAAYVLDWLVTFILGCLLTAAAGMILLRSTDGGRRDASDRAIYASVIIAGLVIPVWLAMTVAGWAWWGRTLGKVAVSIRVVDRRGRPPGIARALVRMMIYIIENVPPAVALPVAGMALALRPDLSAPPIQLLTACGAALVAPLVSLALMLRDPARRALHDLLAGTIVVIE